MQKQLIFKRAGYINDKEPHSEIRIVTVDIPELDKNDGWKLIDCADIIVPPSSPKTKPVDAKKAISAGDSFVSPVLGTAKLTRRATKILISFRKSEKEKTYPNSICIDDKAKQLFFNDVKKIQGPNPTNWEIKSSDSLFKHWNSFIDIEYARQLKLYNGTT